MGATRPATQDYLDLQRRLASTYAALTGTRLQGAVCVLTDLRRRFGLEEEEDAGMWHRFVREARDALLSRLPQMNSEEPWRVFLLQCLVPAAPVESFLGLP